MNSTCELDCHSARALKPYPDYTDSGVEWLGKVPAHWEVLKLRHVLRRHTERERPDLPLLSVVREQGVILRDTTSADENHNYIPDDLSNYKVVRAGQFAMNKMKAWQGSYGVSCHDGIVSPAYFVFDVLGLEVDFFHAAIRSRAYVPAFTRASDGVRIGQWDLAEARMREIQFLVPPAAEQAAIVRFLDYADRRIRRYIRANQKLIALLKEQKQAIIHQAVTGQIDIRTGKPYPVYKDSRVEWLGRIPQRWRAVSLGRLTLDRCDGPFGSGLKSSHYTDEGIRVVRLQNIGHGTFNDEDAVYIAPEHYATLGDHSVQPGDLLIAGLGDPHHPAGRACVAPTNIRPAMVKADCFRFRVDQEAFLPAFAALQLTATAHAASAVLSTGATRQRTNLQSTTGRHVVVPSKSEQARVVEYCTGEKARLDAVQQAAGREILLLGAYRTRLIADVVTGKLDVREAAARLPDEVEELEPLDEADAVIDGEEEPADALATAP